MKCLELGPTTLKMSQNTAKSMAYIMNESGGDLHQGGQGWLTTSIIE